MTRSRKKIPIVGMTTAESDKPYKERENRRQRRVVKVAIRVGDDPPPEKKFADPWRSEKDGKQYWPDPKAYRK